MIIIVETNIPINPKITLLKMRTRIKYAVRVEKCGLKL